MRRLLITLCVLGTLLLAAPAGASEGGTKPHVDVINVGGLIDPVQSDFLGRSIRDAESGGAVALIIQLNSRGGVISQTKVDALAFEVAHSTVPVAVWVGPSGKGRAEGAAFALLRSAGIVGVAPGTRVGNGPPPVFGPADPLANRTIGSAEALRTGVAQLDAPTLVSFVGQLDGKQIHGTTVSTDVEILPGPKGPTQKPQIQVRFAKVGLLASLMHTASSPSVAYLLLLIGLLLMVLEFFTAGVGVAAVVGAGCLVLSAYGLTVLPTRWWAITLLVVAVGGYAIDLQAGAPRFWSGVGTLALVVGTITLVHGQHLSILAMVAGVAGTPLFMVAGMPSMVRARFSTPTIGRESMIGEMGTALADVSPEGTVEIKGAQWRARTNRATPIVAGEPVRVTGIDGLLLEVEPEEGGAKDARH